MMTLATDHAAIGDPVARRAPSPERPPAPHGFTRFERRDIEQSIGARFEEQAGRFPHQLAVRTTCESLTYAELNRLANRVARLILGTTEAGNQPVALLFGQSTLMVAAILGILKAGKFYVPLDPSRPMPQNRSLVMDAGALLLLTEAAFRNHAMELGGPELTVLDLSAMGEDHSGENPGLDLAPDRLAYLFYTSGSTGRPKGVADTHRNVLHNVMRYTNSLRIAPSDRLTLLQPAAFSGAVSSLFGALLNGAASFPFSLQEEGPIRLAAWVSEQRLTMFHGVPSIFRLLASGGYSYPDLRVIRLEGDRAQASDIALYKSRFPDSCTLVNGLGATECGIVRQYFVTRDTPVPEGLVPIGHPVEDMDVLLLDEAGQPLGVGSVGEIAIRSRYLAPGYWKRPDLTAAAFLPDPQGGGERIYRTGDLGRIRQDGCLDYLGRRNFRMKIRGQWVEVAEVEEALRQLGTFREVVVQTIEDGNGAPRLAAYLVPGNGPAAEPAELRRRLALRLPAHMIPSSFVTMDALPLTSFGKVDRGALPFPSPARRQGRWLIRLLRRGTRSSASCRKSGKRPSR
jgi:amino acid adenylation domain-containing protein